MRNYFALSIAMLTLSASVLNAAVVVDFFDTAASSGQLDLSTSTANNAGWASNQYNSGSNSLTIVANLSFANAAYIDGASGRAVQASNSSRAGGRKLDRFWTGTIWMSYLVKMYTTGGANAAVGMREGSGSGNESWPGYGTAVDGVGYTWNADASVYECGAAALTVGQTYLAIARFELSTQGSSLTAWHFAPGDTIPTTEAALNALTANQVSKSSLAYLTTGSANYVVYHGSGIQADSMRLSDQAGDAGLNDVLTVIPEPATMLLLSVGAASLLRRRR